MPNVLGEQPAGRDRRVPSDMTGKEHDGAVRRLDEALREQDRLSHRYNASMGTSSELSAYVRLRAAGEDVTTRGRWLERVDSKEHLVAPGPDRAPSGT
jgi:hypothetical protein